jgi:methylthioribose-1-phosphate isomerase
MVETMRWDGEKLYLLDQTLLPVKEEYLECAELEDVVDAIRKMKVRGAPAIGVAAAFGIVLAIKKVKKPSYKDVLKASQLLSSTRPTARNLFWALDRMLKRVKGKEGEDLKNVLEKEATFIYSQDIEANREIGSFGASLLEDGDVVLTHCNAGALATAGYGTALGVIRSAISQGKGIKVIVTETRPLFQGARLTAWELGKEGIDHFVITDVAAGFLMRRGEISKVIVGADRISSNGDVANKIGTYSLAVLAKENNLPFYVAAPLSTFDFSLQSGDEIPIEERGEEEVRRVGENTIVPEFSKVKNFAFDITPAFYITKYITEKGVLETPFDKGLFKVEEY